ncbi:hypothetical protein [Edaphobacter albus]|uniref:hypothetical protein n=1 Tax=Edaphobacter sp. 4G125 TaxID=2763071 RepID=UPI00164664D0|nr:hypothetical protein [Edaphobacter sp. 4G125]QNI37178.1 hypothetical protein H7846_02275 [Edaphobacter sp. 4G125]
MIVSLMVLCGSYLLIVWKDRSWINWATPAFFFTLGGRYIFQFAYLYFINPSGSHYAYFFSYTTYALSFLTAALVYTFVKPFKLRPPLHSTQDVGLWPWILLLLGFLLYLPILIEFRAYLGDPRRIYALTRTGYGLWFFGSTTVTALAFVTYLFQKHKTVCSALSFYGICAALAYWHGSKGIILTYALIWMLYRVYVGRKTISAFAAIVSLSGVAALVIGSFALFSTAGDIVDLANSVMSYADYVRNSMLVIDDQQGERYYGRLTLENEVYSRIPRALMPDKPKDFGPFFLAKTYAPAAYRAGEGAPAFDIGLQYADFGPISIVFLCFFSGCTAWIMSSALFHLRQWPSPGTFVVVLYLAGVAIITAGSGNYLPEAIFFAGGLSLILRVRIIRGPVSFRRGIF